MFICCSFMTPQYAKYAYNGLKYWNNELYCDYYIASKVCKDWPKDFSVSILKNQCLEAANFSHYDWMILMPGIDSSLISLPKEESLDQNIIYTGYRTFGIGAEPCSLHLYSRKIFEKYRYNENYRYFYDDYDFFYNVTRSIPKKSTKDLLCRSQEHTSLLENPYIKEVAQKERRCFLNSYLSINGHEFPRLV